MNVTGDEWPRIQGVGHPVAVTRTPLAAEPVASVVILNWNGGDLVVESARSVRRQGPPVELVVVDNASSDDSLARVEEAVAPEVVIRCPDNMGFARGMNLGFRAARSDIVILLNCDAILDPDFVTAAIDVVADPRVGVFGGPSWRPRETADSEPVLDAGPITLTRTMRVADLDEPDRSRAVPKTTGSALGLVRSRLAAAGLLLDGAPYDESFWTYGEDNDLSLRVARTGVVTWYDERLRSVHARSSSSAERIWDKRGRLRRNLVAGRHRNITRHLRGTRRASARLLAIAEDVALIARQVAKGDLEVVSDVRAAHRDVRSARQQDRIMHRVMRRTGPAPGLPWWPTRRRYGR